VHKEQLSTDGVRAVDISCRLAVSLHVTIVHKITERKVGEAPLMVLQFMVELVGTKAVDNEAPPRNLHFNQDPWGLQPQARH
jgi:hydroxyproline O-galactosyltransferase 2/3/4/5/6